MQHQADFYFDEQSVFRWGIVLMDTINMKQLRMNFSIVSLPSIYSEHSIQIEFPFVFCLICLHFLYSYFYLIYSTLHSIFDANEHAHQCLVLPLFYVQFYDVA